MKIVIDWGAVITQAIGNIPTLLTVVIGLYLVRSNRRSAESAADKSDAEREKLEQAKRLELEAYYEGLSKKLEGELEVVRLELKEIKADAIRTLSALYYLISQVKEDFPEAVQTAIKMLEQV